ncbi:MAG TPA: hydrolase [Longimicrobiales bacterium]|nr:hydrolase [Longimicrobiales bacterium]
MTIADEVDARVRGFEPDRFRAPWWLHGGHVQTVGGKLLRRDVDVALERERIDTPDGDFLDLDIARADTGADPAPVAVVLHGLEGSARKPYMLLAYRALTSAGITAVGMNFRGCSGEPNRARRLYHSGETGDLRTVLAHVATRFPGSPVGAIGFSIGGNVLLKYLGEEGDDARSTMHAAVAISVPFDLAAGADNIERGPMGKVYTHYFMRSLRQKAVIARARLQGLCDVDAAIRARTLRDFDDALTAPVHGFADASDYYRRCGSCAFLHAIRVPTLLIQAEDDPFQRARDIPWGAIRSNPWLITAISRTGGHVGFIGGTPWRPLFRAEDEAARFVAHALKAAGAS